MFDRVLVGMIYEQAGILRPEYVYLINHSFGVASIAGFLGRKLNQRGLQIDIGLAESGAALHDIGKMFDESSRGHTIEGVKFLRTLGLDEKIVRIVQTHAVYFFEPRIMPNPSSWEEKLVFLGDLIFGIDIMFMEKRREDIINRYHDKIPKGRVEWLRTISQEIHQEILEILAPEPMPF